ncbi:MAG: tape measure protein [Clostridiales bacterium]|nr:tape measure protein [Clostridiales bacterium]
MATLKAMFKLSDGYSATVNKIVSGTDRASSSALKASKNTDKYNDSLKNTGASASVASNGLTKFISVAAALAGLKKSADLTDTYTNTAARLKMVNDGTQTQVELQNKIFAAANRARGSYTDMASAVAKMNLLAGDNFGSNDEAIGFTELLQKSLKVSGAGKSEQDSAFLQLSQAMAAGKLQGDEFRSVMENAPMVANAIAKYMGKSKGELKELSSKGVITADIIKGALFAAADDINDKFATMPMTFSDVWSKIKNAGNQAFGGVFEKLNQLLNSDAGQSAINNLIGAIYLAGQVTENFIDFAVAAWPIVSPFIWAAVAAVGAYAIAMAVANIQTLIGAVRFGAQAIGVGLYALAMWATSGATWAQVTAQLGLNSALYACPIVWIIGLILVLVALFYAAVAATNHFAGTSVSATGIIAGVFGVMIAWVVNKLIFMWNTFAIIANAIGNAFNDPVAAVKIAFYDMAVNVLGYMQSIAKGIEDLLNAIPGVEVSVTAGMDNLISGLKSKSQTLKDESGWKEYVHSMEYVDLSGAFKKGYSVGTGIEDKLGGLFKGFIPPGGDGSGQFATAGNPATVKGTGKGGAVKVENEEDIEWLRKLAERDFVARIAQNTLAPNIKVEFTGPITKEADVDGVASHIGNILKDQISMAPEGVY